jgi:hypothetical protein
MLDGGTVMFKKIMSNVINKAVKQGYEPVPGRRIKSVIVTIQTTSASYVDFQVYGDNGRIHGLMVGLNDVIFDHSFAKAYWGKDYKDHLKLLAVQSSIKGRVNYIGTSV